MSDEGKRYRISTDQKHLMEKFFNKKNEPQRGHISIKKYESFINKTNDTRKEPTLDKDTIERYMRQARKTIQDAREAVAMDAQSPQNDDEEVYIEYSPSEIVQGVVSTMIKYRGNVMTIPLIRALSIHDTGSLCGGRPILITVEAIYACLEFLCKLNKIHRHETPNNVPQAYSFGKVVWPAVQYTIQELGELIGEK